MKKQILMLIVIIAITSATVFAQKPEVITSSKPGWHKITDLRVSYKTDRDEVLVLGNDHFKQLKFKAYDANVDITNAEVYYEGDERPQKLDINIMLNVGMESKTYTLRDEDINKVVLVYKSIPTMMEGKERGTVEIWGMK